MLWAKDYTLVIYILFPKTWCVRSCSLKTCVAQLQCTIKWWKIWEVVLLPVDLIGPKTVRSMKRVHHFSVVVLITQTHQIFYLRAFCCCWVNKKLETDWVIFQSLTRLLSPKGGPGKFTLSTYPTILFQKLNVFFILQRDEKIQNQYN